MSFYEVIYRKRNGETLRTEEIDSFVRGVTDGSLPPAQVAAWLMAAFIRGLSDREMTDLTRAMTKSGDTLDLSSIPGRKVDKHSTGGVGDGTSLVLAPLLAAAGAVVPMMSGRALGHTGGTLDKLEAIPGFRVDLTADEFRDVLRRVGCAMIGQTARVAPADRTLYALRDVTATVDSVPLIAASIMSKKLAEGTESLVLDVKTGSGAFMRELKDARALAKAMVAIGNGAGVRTKALITDMDQPLGNVAGDALEVRQALETLRGGGPKDFVELCLTLGSHMLVLAKLAKTEKTARAVLAPLLANGKALAKFRAMVEAQGGDVRAVDKPDESLPLAPVVRQVPAPKAGRVSKMETRELGLVVASLGAGRAKPGDPVDHGVGLVFHKKVGDTVAKGEPIATVYSRREDAAEEAVRRVQATMAVGRGPVRATHLVREIVG